MLKADKSPKVLVKELGLEQVSDEGAIALSLMKYWPKIRSLLPTLKPEKTVLSASWSVRS